MEKSASLSVASVRLSFHFGQPVRVDNYPAFVLRSVLGFHFRNRHCVTRAPTCGGCLFLKTCAYALVFETPADKTNAALPGRDRVFHPYRLYLSQQSPGQIETLEAVVQLYGDFRRYLPHVLTAFADAATRGLFRSRSRATFKALNREGKMVFEGGRFQPENADVSQRELLVKEQIEERAMEVRCLTPLRLTVRGRHTDRFSGDEFLEQVLRRVQGLISLYGSDAGGNLDIPFPKTRIARRDLRWVEYPHWSGRQRALMRLGGVEGSFVIEGRAPSLYWEALRLAGELGVGNNTSMGFGQVEVRPLDTEERFAFAREGEVNEGGRS